MNHKWKILRLLSLVDLFSWQWAFAFLAIGPMIGIWAMVRLQGMMNREEVLCVVRDQGLVPYGD